MSAAAKVPAFQPGERVRVVATRQLAEVYEVSIARGKPTVFRCGWSIGGTAEQPLAGVDQWFYARELERV